ncbi:uncharacterized, partial [Tachysurus ichikawai]
MTDKIQLCCSSAFTQNESPFPIKLLLHHFANEEATREMENMALLLCEDVQRDVVITRVVVEQ